MLCGHRCEGACGALCDPCKRKKCLVSLCAHKDCKARDGGGLLCDIFNALKVLVIDLDL